MGIFNDAYEEEIGQLERRVRELEAENARLKESIRRMGHHDYDDDDDDREEWVDNNGKRHDGYW